jgi:hypothetical protein
MKRIFGSLLFVIVFTSVSFALTLGEIRQQVRYDISDSTDTVNINSVFTDTTLNARINMVVDQITSYTRCLKGRCLITPIAETQEYRLPEDCIAVDRVAFVSVAVSSTTYRKLVGREFVGLDVTYPTWESQGSGCPREYYIRRNLLGLYPKPSATYAQVRALKLDYYKRSAQMVSDSDEPFDGDYSLRQYHYLVITGVTVMCRRSLNIDYSSLKSEFLADVAIMKESVKFAPDITEIISVTK